MNFLRLSELDLAGKRVFIRADFNVPFNPDGTLADDTRIRATLPAICHCLEAGAAVMVTSHLGRPNEGALTAADSLAPVAAALSALLGHPVALIRDWTGGNFRVQPGEVVLLENCRGNFGEKADDPALAARIARFIDVYVNDAFGTAHRKECTLHALALAAPVACAGPLMTAELDALGRALAQPARPLAAIVAGSKVSTKLDVLISLSLICDQLIVGGGIANTFLAAAGYKVGKSLYEADLVDTAKAIAAKVSVPLPVDVVVAKAFAEDAEATVKAIADVADDDMILDIGPESAKALAAIIANAGTVVWNGPVGVFEMDAFANGTKALAAAVASSKAFTLAGGGDTVSAINVFKIEDKVGYISTAGGAFLEFLEGKRLPAVDILESRFKD